MQDIKQNDFGINCTNDRCQIQINVHMNIGIDKSFDLTLFVRLLINIV